MFKVVKESYDEFDAINEMVEEIKEKYGFDVKDEYIEEFASKYGIDPDFAKDVIYSDLDEYGFKCEGSELNKSMNALDEIDKLAGNDEHLAEIGRRLGLEEFKKFLKDNPGVKKSIVKEEVEEGMTFEEIINMMEIAQDYGDLYNAAGYIKNDSLRVDVETQIGDCEDDGDSVEVAYSVVTSDLLDSHINDKNVENLEECNKSLTEDEDLELDIDLDEEPEELELNAEDVIDVPIEEVGEITPDAIVAIEPAEVPEEAVEGDTENTEVDKTEPDAKAIIEDMVNFLISDEKEAISGYTSRLGTLVNVVDSETYAKIQDVINGIIKEEQHHIDELLDLYEEFGECDCE